MKTFQTWPDWLLGSTLKFEPYHTASARPAPPALIQGKTLTASPVTVDPSLTWTGLLQFVHPLAAEDALTKTCRWTGLFVLSAHVMNRLRALSMDSTVKSVLGEPGKLSAMWINLLESPHGLALFGKSRNVRSPLASGVPIFSNKLEVPSEF
jgi:hypothetical protein